MKKIAGMRRLSRSGPCAFDAGELLPRKEISVMNEKTRAYYEGKVIMITGGGGSIGSEICRQLAGMNAGRLVIVDICENGAYDVQQELRIASGNRTEAVIEITSITNEKGMDRVFRSWRPDILINAAADTGDNDAVRRALHEAVPTYREADAPAEE